MPPDWLESVPPDILAELIEEAGTFANELNFSRTAIPINYAITGDKKLVPRTARKAAPKPINNLKTEGKDEWLKYCLQHKSKTLTG